MVARALIPRSLVLTPTSTLTHGFDLDERTAACPSTHTIKGMFFARFADAATRAGVDASSLRLEQPVERYLAFRDYPVRDYMRWAAAAAARAHPRVAVSEGLRRVALDDYARFLDSGLGKVMTAFLSDARAVLMQSNKLYEMVMKGPRVESEADGDEIVVRFRDYHGPVECYPAGTLEGACRHFGGRYEIRVEVVGPAAADYRVRLG